MTGQSPNILEYAELLLAEGKLQEARQMLSTFIQRSPGSADAWWMMSQVVEDPRQEMDCLERVLHLAPAHEKAHRRLAELKSTENYAVSPAPPTTSAPKTPAPIPQTPAFSRETAPKTDGLPTVQPFVFDDKEQPAEEAFDLFEPGAFDGMPSIPSAPVIPVESVESKPAATEESDVPAWAEPVPVNAAAAGGRVEKGKKKRTWIVDVVIISVVLCLLLAVVGYFLLSDMGKAMLSNLQGTQVVAQVLTSQPPQTLAPTWTASLTNTLPPTKTRTLTPTVSETPLFTPENTLLPPGAIGLMVGKYPPDFTLVNTISGAEVSLSDYMGRPVILFFWATWCPYCNDEITTLQEIYEAYDEEGLMVLAVESGGSYAEVAAYESTHGVTFPLLTDEDYEISTRYEVGPIPHHVFINLSGKITYLWTGELDYDELDIKVRGLMRTFSTSTPSTP
jgi:peroxiredoxin